jgi:hypothetical protein
MLAAGPFLAGIADAQAPPLAPGPPANTPPPPAATQPSIPTRVTRQTTFDIPFSVDVSRGAPTEVQLFVSQDAGRTWQFYMRQPPDGKSFPFRTTGDGQFWFAPRTIDPRRNAPRVDQLKPELCVIVDTQQPQLDFTAVAGAAGEVTTAWKIADAGSDLKTLRSTLRIEYQAAPNAAWRRVAIDPAKVWETGGSVVGEMAWVPEGTSESVAVRVEVTDAAGNKAVVNRQVTRPVAVARKPADPNVPPDPYANAVAPLPVASAPPAQDKPLANDNTPPAAAAPAGPAADYIMVGSNVGPQAVGGEPEAASPLSDSQDYPPARGGNFPPVADRVETNQPIENDTYDRSDTRTRASGLPPGERPSMTNSLHFQLDYELDAVGPRGVHEVQLWGTTDYGKTWTNWKLDDDLQSPIDVQVEREGMYGFRVVIVGRNGLSTPAPNPGEPADVWVGVDVTKPAVRITSAIYGEGIHAGELDMHWLASDEALGERPVTLMFSERPDGPWTTIAAGLPNTGQYFWKVDANIPQKIFLRLEVYDDAGNLGDHQLVEAVNTRGLIPKAFIRSVRPVAAPEEAYRPNGYRYR